LPGARLPGAQGVGGPLSGLDALDLDIPIVPGYAVAGTVDVIGAAVAHLKPGDPVVGMLKPGWLLSIEWWFSSIPKGERHSTSFIFICILFLSFYLSLERECFVLT
jgi:hypothetical protein